MFGASLYTILFIILLLYCNNYFYFLSLSLFLFKFLIYFLFVFFLSFRNNYHLGSYRIIFVISTRFKGRKINDTTVDFLGLVCCNNMKIISQNIDKVDAKMLRYVTVHGNESIISLRIHRILKVKEEISTNLSFIFAIIISISLHIRPV